MSTNVNKGQVGGQKRPKIANVVLERPPTYIYMYIVNLGRRIDGLDNKLQGQEQSQRNMMDQMMKLSQELKVCIKVTL